MFPITCNAVGDIIAVAQLACDVRSALSESTGAPKDVQDLITELHTLESLLSDASKLIADAADRHLQSQVLEQVQRCGEIVNNMLDKLIDFSPLECDAVPAVAMRERLRRGVLKLRWRFSKQAEARECRAKLERCRVELLVILNITNHSELRERLVSVGMDVSNIETRTEAVSRDVASLKNLVHRDVALLKNSVRGDVASSAAIIIDEANLNRQSAHHDLAGLREDLAARDEKMIAFISNALSQNGPATAIASRRADESSPAQKLAKSIIFNVAFCAEFFGFLRKEMSTVQVGIDANTRQGPSNYSPTPTEIASAAEANQPLAILAIALAAVSSLDVRTGLAIASCYALFRAISSQRHAMAGRMTYSNANMVVLIDLLGRRKLLDPAMCASPEAFKFALLSLFNDNPCEILVREDRHELAQVGSADPIDPKDWEAVVRSGTELEMNAYTVRKWSIGIKACPHCSRVLTV